MSKELEAFELLCQFLVEEMNTLRHKDLNEDYFYNKKYGVTITSQKTGIEYTTADIADALKRLEIYDKCNYQTTIHKDVLQLSKELKALEIISQNFELVGNCLHAKNKYAEDGWVFVKEIEDEEEFNAWKEVLL